MTLMTTSGLLQMDTAAGKAGPATEPAVLDELTRLALGTPDRAERSRRLFLKLRKSLGSPRFDQLVFGIVSLARQSHPAGARLLASFLDTTTREARVVPPLGRLSSSRRLFLILESDKRKANAFSRDWLARLATYTDRVATPSDLLRGAPTDPTARMGSEHPWGALCKALADAVEIARQNESPDPRIIELIRDLLRLEVDALEERASRLAGIIDPFRVAAVQRLLPILGSLDPRIRDTRLFISSLHEAELDSNFRKQWPRALEVMEDSEYRDLRAALEGLAAARPLVDLLALRAELPRPISLLAATVDGLGKLGERLAAAGMPSVCDNLLGATELAVRCDGERGVEIPLTPEERAAVAPLLADFTGPGRAGIAPYLMEDLLVLPWPEPAIASRDWPHDLPAADIVVPVVAPSVSINAEGASDEEGALSKSRKDDLCATEIKKLVMNSMQTTSVLLSYLRNAKVTSIPGLVGEIANRTRNPQIIATIANDRTLYSGFANRDVPLACLRNPSNVSVKILRKFVHVKYVSKMDLKMLAQDKAGVRRELRREIEHYLESLS